MEAALFNCGTSTERIGDENNLTPDTWYELYAKGNILVFSAGQTDKAFPEYYLTFGHVDCCTRIRRLYKKRAVVCAAAAHNTRRPGSQETHSKIGDETAKSHTERTLVFEATHAGHVGYDS